MRGGGKAVEWCAGLMNYQEGKEEQRSAGVCDENDRCVIRMIRVS